MFLMFQTTCKYTKPSRLEIRDIDDFKDILVNISPKIFVLNINWKYCVSK